MADSSQTIEPSALLQQATFTLSTALPESPIIATLYHRQKEELSKGEAEALIRRMGVNGPIQERRSEGGNTIVRAESEDFMISVESDTAPLFSYGTSAPAQEMLVKAYTFDELKSMAESFLHSHQLATCSYRVVPNSNPNEEISSVIVAQVIDNLPLYQGDQPWIWMRFDAEGQVDNLYYYGLQLISERESAVFFALRQLAFQLHKTYAS